MSNIVTGKTTSPRRNVNLSLDAAIVREAKALTDNLSATVEGLLARFVTEEQARKRAADEHLDKVMLALTRYHAEHGFLSDEFPNL